MSRHDITTGTWQRIEPILCPSCEERRGRPTKDTCNILNCTIWILRAGAPWRDLPREFCPQFEAHKRINS